MTMTPETSNRPYGVTDIPAWIPSKILRVGFRIAGVLLRRVRPCQALLVTTATRLAGLQGEIEAELLWRKKAQKRPFPYAYPPTTADRFAAQRIVSVEASPAHVTPPAPIPGVLYGMTAEEADQRGISLDESIYQRAEVVDDIPSAPFVNVAALDPNDEIDR